MIHSQSENRKRCAFASTIADARKKKIKKEPVCEKGGCEYFDTCTRNPHRSKD